MSGYSVDLRERIIQAWETGRTQAWIAATYTVSVSSIKRYIQRYKTTGHVEATVQRRMAPRISAAYEPALRALVARMPKAKLEVYCTEWEAETGIVVSPKTMSRMLVRLSLRQKNDGRRPGAG